MGKKNTQHYSAFISVLSFLLELLLLLDVPLTHLIIETELKTGIVLKKKGNPTKKTFPTSNATSAVTTVLGIKLFVKRC